VSSHGPSTDPFPADLQVETAYKLSDFRALALSSIMPNGEEVLRPKMEELILPSATDVRRAKHAILRALEDGRAHRSAWLIARAAEDIGSPPHVQPVAITLHEQPTPEAIDPDSPAMVFVRDRLAAVRGPAELAFAGVVVPAADPGSTVMEVRDDPLRLLDPEQGIHIGINHPGGSFGVRPRADRPIVGQSYMLTHQGDARWYLDPDLFAGEIGDLELSERARRALREALDSFRRGLYLASASLLGVVSEAAWFAAAERLAELPPIAKAVEEEATAQVQSLVINQLRATKGLAKTLPDQLLAHAALLRAIRNYGVHPRAIRDDLEHWFTEDACGLLLLQTNHYLTQLAGAIEVADNRSDASG
jgi:hypothetical protein